MSASVHTPSPQRPQHVIPKGVPVPPSFPALYFLDFQSWQYRQGLLPLIEISPSKLILDFIQEPHSIARLYFATVHPFFPFISSRNFYEHFPPAHIPPNGVLVVLIACMKLVSWSPKDDPKKDPKSQLYLAVKRMLVETDIAGIFSLQLLQATVLVALYELGHAIYPAAYTSIGACARYALALNINEGATMGMDHPAVAPPEQEEKRRAWWAILILDRYGVGYLFGKAASNIPQGSSTSGIRRGHSRLRSPPLTPFCPPMMLCLIKG